MATKSDWCSNRTWLLAVLVSVALIRFAVLGMYPLLDPTEGRYAEISREMAATDDWITPQLERDQPFLGKPPLFFWLTALGFKILGLSEFSARFPSYIMGVLTAVLTYILGMNLYGRTLALFGVLILTTTALFNTYTGWVATDTTLAAAITLSMVSFPLAIRAESRQASMGWGYAFFIGIGLSLLTKGLVGCVLIGTPLTVWTVWHSRYREIWSRLPWIGGSLLALAIAVPWHVLAEWANPGFLNYYIIGEHFERFFESGWKGDMYGSAHAYPRGMIWLFALVDTAPWIGIFLTALLWLRTRGGSLRGRPPGRRPPARRGVPPRGPVP